MKLIPPKWSPFLQGLVLFLWLNQPVVFAQGQKQVTLKSGNAAISLADIFKAIRQQTGYTVFYNNLILNDKEKMKVDFNGSDLPVVLNTVLKDKNIEWTFNDIYIILKKKDNAASPSPKQEKLQGRVTDDTGQPLARASVRIKNTTAAALTDANGNFSIALPEPAGTLQIGFVGYEPLEIPVKDMRFQDIKLKPANSGLNEVIVIGYGTTTRKDLTGSVGKANVEDMQKAPVASFDQALAGRIAGVEVSSNDGQPGAASRIVVRGSSVSQDGSPLFVIDGFPIENMDINSINPNDIASLEVLKDASSIAIYGARGANGVIIINTKRGKPGPPRVTYSYALGMQQITKKMEMLSPYEFVKLQLELDSIRSSPTTPVTTNALIYLDPAHGITLDSYKNNSGYDWQDLLVQTGLTQNHSLNISAGTADTRYSISGSYYDQKGIIINTGLKRYDGKFTLDQRLNKNLRMGITAGYSNSTSYGTIPAAAASGGVVQGMWQYRPVSGVGNQDLLNEVIDSLALEDFNNGASNATLGNNLVNPLLQAQNEYRKNINNTGTINAFLEYTFLKKFRLKISGGYNATNLKSETFYNSQTQQGNLFRNQAGAIPNTNGINGTINNQLNSNYLSENILNYKTTIGKKHTIDALAGFTYQYATNNYTGFRSINVPQSTEYLGIKSISGGTATLPNSGGSRWQMFSFLGRLNYAFEDKYLFTATARSDGSSKFAAGKQWGYFPSGAFAWRFTEESFAAGLRSILNDGKFRASYGSVGNNKVGDFSYLATLAGGTQFAYPFNNSYTRGTVPFGNGNPDLTWETTTELDLGLNLSFFNDRISIDADYYHRKTKNFLLLVQIPYLGGYSISSSNTQYQNTGEISNRGFEFTINTLNIKGKNFNWSSSFNISFNKGKIDKFYDGFEVMQTRYDLPGGNNTTGWIAKVDAPISQFYGYKWAGVYQYDDFVKQGNGTYILKNGVPGYSTGIQPGDPKYQDINGDGVVDANDQTTLGSPLPIHTGGFSNNFSYKHFYLNIFLQWSYGNEILNANRMAFASTGGYYPNGNQFAEYANRWTPDNPTNDVPRALYNNRGDAGSNTPKVTSRYIEDGSFLRLKTISLGYDLPQEIIRRAGFKGLRAYVAAQNIFTITNYSGIDPEVSSFRVQNPANAPGNTPGVTATSGTGYTFLQPSSSYSALSGGLDYTAYPRAFTLSFGITATF
jgi:TonB-linked SusC/RagA family outer membrane protein